MHRVTALLLVSLLFACSDKQTEQPASPSKADPPAEEHHADPNAAPADESPGLRENCDFVVGEDCFTEQDAACKAAGCTPENCVVLESYPAQIRCG